MTSAPKQGVAAVVELAVVELAVVELAGLRGFLEPPPPRRWLENLKPF